MFVEPYMANVTIFAGNFAPRSWAFCNGQLVAISVNSALFALIGTTYGGDGVTTFALPDLRGRVAIHAGQGPGMSPYVIGQQAGAESITFITPQIPAHNHTYINASGAPGGNTAAGTVSNANGAVPAQLAGTSLYSTATSGSVMGDSTCITNTVLTGGSQPIAIMQPYLVMNYIICVEGIFPSRN